MKLLNRKSFLKNTGFVAPVLDLGSKTLKTGNLKFIPLHFNFKKIKIGFVGMGVRGITLPKAIIIVLVVLINTSFVMQDGTRTVGYKITLDNEIYTKSISGYPPQLAIWLVNEKKKELINIAITHCSAKNDWVGKSTNPIALPIWSAQSLKYNVIENDINAYNIEVDAISSASIKLTDIFKNMFANEPEKLVDGISCATPTNFLEGYFKISNKEEWLMFVEVNCSGDYNNFYQFKNKDSGEVDHYGNGQPSIIYKGTIDGAGGNITVPTMYGKSDQYLPIGEINVSLDSITSAKKLIREINVYFE